MAMPSGATSWRVGLPSESPRSPPSATLGAKTRMEDSSIAGGTGGAKTEAELEAERIWWSEISERQVSQLETTFNAEFQRTCRALRTEIGASKDKLEMMVEEERQRREAGIAELRQLIEGQNAIMIAEVSQRVQNKQPAQEVIQDVRSELSFLQEDLQGTKAEWRRVSSLSAQMESMVRSLETEMGLQARRYDGLKELLPRVETLEDKCQQQSEPAPDYGPRIQVLSDELRMSKQAVATVIARADKLEAELQKATSEASPALARVAELERSLLKLSGDAVPRIQDHLEALVQQERTSREGDLADLKIKVESQSAKIVPEEKLQTLVEQEKLRREAGIAELRSLVEGQAAMVTTEVRKQTQADQDKLQIMFAEEKSRRETGLAELRNLMDGQKTLLADMMIQQAQQRVAGGPTAVGTPTPSTSSVATAGGPDQSQTVGRLVCDVQDLRSQLVALKEEAQGAKADSRQSIAASSQLETLVHTLENDANRQAKLLEGLTHLRPRLETVEDKIEQQLASQSQLRPADGEVKAAQEAIAAVRSRTDQCEQGLRRFALDSSAVTDRLKLIESEVSSMSRDGVPLMKEVKILLNDFLTVAMMEAKARDNVAPAGPQPVAHVGVERQSSIKSSVPSMAPPASLMSPKPGVEIDGNEEQHVTVLSSELKDLKLLLQHFQAAAAEFRYQPPKQPTRQNSSGSLSPRGQASSVDWEGAPADKPNKPAAVGELKESIEALVNRVNDTLVHNATLSAPSSVTSSSSRRQPGEPPAASPAQREQFRFMKALQAVRDLRERNVDLRGRNAELAELLSQDVPAATPAASIQAPVPAPAPERQATQGPFPTDMGSCRSPNISPRIQGLISTTTSTGGTTPQGQQRASTLGQPGPGSSFASRAPSIGPRTLSSQPTPQLRSPGAGRPGSGCPNPTPQLRGATMGPGGPGPGAAVTSAGQRLSGTAPSSTLGASPLVLRQPGRVVPTTSSRPGPVSR